MRRTRSGSRPRSASVLRSCSRRRTEQCPALACAHSHAHAHPLNHTAHFVFNAPSLTCRLPHTNGAHPTLPACMRKPSPSPEAQPPPPAPAPTRTCARVLLVCDAHLRDFVYFHARACVSSVGVEVTLLDSLQTSGASCVQARRQPRACVRVCVRGCVRAWDGRLTCARMPTALGSQGCTLVRQAHATARNVRRTLLHEEAIRSMQGFQVQHATYTAFPNAIHKIVAATCLH